MFEVLGVLIGVGGVILFGFISSGVWKKEKKYCLECNNLIKDPSPYTKTCSACDAKRQLDTVRKYCPKCNNIIKDRQYSTDFCRECEPINI